MSLPSMLPRPADRPWRLDGCGPRCRNVYATFPGRRYPERLPIHDPLHHEAHGEHVLAPQATGAIPRTITRTGGLVVDTVRAVVSVAGRDVALTPIEWGLLAHLAAHLGQLCTQVDVLHALCGDAYAPRPLRRIGGRMLCPDLHLLRVHLSRLRAKLGPAARLIETRRGLGYILVEEPVL